MSFQQVKLPCYHVSDLKPEEMNSPGFRVGRAQELGVERLQFERERERVTAGPCEC